MNDLTVFKFEGTREVRAVIKDGEPWFVAKDICDILGIQNTSDAVRNLDDDELVSEKAISGGQVREMLCVSESGLYALVMRSNKPQAKAFLYRKSREMD